MLSPGKITNKEGSVTTSMKVNYLLHTQFITQGKTILMHEAEILFRINMLPSLKYEYILRKHLNI